LRRRRLVRTGRDFVGSEAAVAAVGAISIVEGHEISAPAVELSEGREHPRVAKDGFLERAKQPLDSSVGPRMGGSGQ